MDTFWRKLSYSLHGLTELSSSFLANRPRSMSYRQGPSVSVVGEGCHPFPDDSLRLELGCMFFLHFDIFGLPLVEDQQTAIRSLYQCPNLGGSPDRMLAPLVSL